MSSSRDPESGVAAAERIVEVLLGAWRARCLYVGVQLGLHTALDTGGRTATQIARQIGADPDALLRLLRVWVDMDIVGHDPAAGTYFLTSAFSSFGAGSPDGDLADLVRLYEHDFRPAWDNLEVWARNSATTGFEAAFGHDIHLRLGSDPEFRQAFSRGMGALDVVFGQFADLCGRAADPGPWTFADIGGGRGALARAVVVRSGGRATGTAFDLPHVVGEGEPTAGVTTTAGDMFDRVPAGFDHYFLSRILQDWDDARSGVLLANIRSAAAEAGGRLWVLERCVGPGHHLANLWDVHLGCVAGGTHRTEHDYRRLFAESGWVTRQVRRISLEMDVFELALT